MTPIRHGLGRRSVQRVRVTVLLGTLGLLTGCAGTTALSASMARDGSLRVDAPDDPSYDYKVTIATVWDVGFDTRKQSDRVLAIRGYLQEACPTVTVVSEQFLRTADGPLGGERGLYVTKVKCDRAGS